MESFTILVLSLLLLLTVSILLSWIKQHGNPSLPPGPTPIPLLGNPKYMDFRAAHKNFKELSEKYGPVFTIWKKSEPVIILCGYEVVKDALVNYDEQFSERPIIPVLRAITNGYGIHGPRWRPLRRFTMNALRNVGMGKKAMESKILAEFKKVIQALSQTGGKPFNPTMLLGCAAGNIISSMLLGEHFDYQDEKLHELLSHMSEMGQRMISPLNMLCNTVPVLLKFSFIMKQILKENEFLHAFIKKYIKRHKETLNPESPRDFMDYYLLKIKEVEREKDPDFCDTSLLMMVAALLEGGAHTTSSTLKFSLMLLANYPDVQAKVQQEIDEVTKSLRSPEIMDKPQLPYTNAVIHEIQRVFDLADIIVFHTVSEDTKFRGYTIPKGVPVLPYLSSVLSDPTKWETPEAFNPGHFLDEEGQFRTRAEFLAFSAGKRVCPGESLVRMELFLFVSTLLQKFTFTLPPGTERQDAKYLKLNKKKLIESGELCAVPRSLSE